MRENLRLFLKAAVVLLAVTPLASTPTAAQEVSTGEQEVTFDEALRLALQQSTRIRRAETGVSAAGEAVEFARAAFLPDLSATIQPTRRFGLSFDQTTGSLQQSTSDAMTASVSTSLNLFNGFRDSAELSRRRVEREAGQFTLKRTREDIVFTVAAQFLAVVLDREIISIRSEALAAQVAQLERVEQLVEGGVRPRADLLAQAAVLAEAELAVLQAESALDLSETELVRTLQLDPRGQYRFVAPSLDGMVEAPETLDLQRMIDVAYERRPDLRAQELQVRAAEEGVRVASSGYYPRINAFASVGSSYSSLARRPIEGTVSELPVTTQSGEAILVGGVPLGFPVGPTFESTPFGDQFFTENRSGAVGISVAVPIFDRFVTRSQVRQARLAVENERILQAQLAQDVAVEVRQAYLDYRNVEKRLEVAGRQVDASRAALAAEEDRYDLGVSTLVELTQARARMVEAESVLAQATAQYVFQRRRLEYTAGLIDPTIELFD
jgi:outer membrane protein